MPNEVLVKQGTAIVWDGAGTDFGISLESVANDAAAQGAKGDLGATRARQFLVSFFLETGAAAPTAGEVYELWWATSSNATAGSDNPGGASGTDIAYKAGEEDEFKVQLQFIGALVLTADASAIQMQQFTFSPPSRYGMPVVVNKSGQTSETNDDEHKIVLTPQPDEIQ